MFLQQHLLLHLHLLSVISFSFLSVVFSDLAADTSALLRLRAAVRGRTLGWNTSSPTPCQWEGIKCEPIINRVIEIRLPGDRLSGQLPGNTIGTLTQLRVLSLRHNSLSGPIPSDISLCIELVNINLEDNLFSGEIPNGFFQLNNLLRLNLASNGFSGHISTEFNNLTKLRTLYLQNNNFNGSISLLNGRSLLQEFNVSFNNLTGQIPQGLNQFPQSSFLGNSLCGLPLESCPQSNGVGGGGSKIPGGAIAGIVLGSIFGLILLLLVFFLLWRKHKRGEHFRQPEMSTPFPPSPVKAPGFEVRGIMRVEDDGLVFLDDNFRVLALDELLIASAEVLGKGVIGTTYRAYLKTGENVVVKRLRNICVSEDEFKERVEKLGSLNHKNLAPPRAYFFGKDEKLLVFESFPIGSLHSILHGKIFGLLLCYTSSV